MRSLLWWSAPVRPSRCRAILRTTCNVNYTSQRYAQNCAIKTYPEWNEATVVSSKTEIPTSHSSVHAQRSTTRTECIDGAHGTRSHHRHPSGPVDAGLAGLVVRRHCVRSVAADNLWRTVSDKFRLFIKRTKTEHCMHG